MAKNQEAVSRRNVTRQTVTVDPLNFELVDLKVGTDSRKVTVKVVLPKTVEGCRMLLEDAQHVADVRRALRIRYQEETGARAKVRDASPKVSEADLTKEIQATMDAWDRHSAVSRAQPKTVSFTELPKTPEAMLEALKAAGINITITK